MLSRVSWISKIERLITDGRPFEARQETAELIKISLQGLRYLETYVARVSMNTTAK